MAIAYSCDNCGAQTQTAWIVSYDGRQRRQNQSATMDWMSYEDLSDKHFCGGPCVAEYYLREVFTYRGKAVVDEVFARAAAPKAD